MQECSHARFVKRMQGNLRPAHRAKGTSEWECGQDRGPVFAHVVNLIPRRYEQQCYFGDEDYFRGLHDQFDLVVREFRDVNEGKDYKRYSHDRHAG